LLISFLIIGLPFFLIVVQPSLGVAILTAAGFFGALLASNIAKKYIAIGILIGLLLIPVFWLFLADYQKDRVTAFLNPTADRLGAGYNSVQSMIAVGSGKLLGRGLGKGVQTQLAFLPEKHTDFIFAATAEELGFIGSMLLLCGLFIVLLSLIHIVENSRNKTARAYVSAVFFVMLLEIMIHVGMNLGIFPITGVPLPFISAGGSSLIGSSISVAIALAAKKREIN
jgi:rod shape determining protein RodA